VRNTRIITLALALAAALSMTAVATASAAPPELVNKEGKEVVKKKFTGTAGKENTFETKSGEKVKCTGGSSSGEVTGLKTQTVTNTFTGCSAISGLAKCKSNGASSGDISLKANAKLVFLDSESEEKVGVDLALPENVTIVCEALGVKETLTVKGSTLCTTTTELSETATIGCKESKGVQEFTEYEEGKERHKGVITETEGKGLKEFKFEQSGLSSTNTLKFEEKVEIKK